MPSQRLRGQETSILIVRDGQLEDTLTNVRNFNWEHQLEISSLGYLGMKSELKDEIVKGAKGDLELHLSSQAWFQFVQAILSRATRETPDVVFNITSVMSFPNGETFSMTFPDIKFGAIPHSTSAREEYLTVKLEWECETPQPAFG